MSEKIVSRKKVKHNNTEIEIVELRAASQGAYYRRASISLAYYHVVEIVQGTKSKGMFQFEWEKTDFRVTGGRYPDARKLAEAMDVLQYAITLAKEWDNDLTGKCFEPTHQTAVSWLSPAPEPGTESE